jgi:hypothetical protein
VEARQTFTGSAVPKGLMFVLAICAAIALAAMGVAVSKSVGVSGTSLPSVGHAAPGTVLRQDNPVQSSTLIDRAAEDQAPISAPVGSHTGRSSGTQIDNSGFGLAAGDGGGYQSDLTRVLPTETQAYNPGWDAKSVREGHGA